MKKKIKNNRYRKVCLIGLLIVVLIVLIFCGKKLKTEKDNSAKDADRKEEMIRNVPKNPTKNSRENVDNADVKEQKGESRKIYSFLQGPKSWKKKRKWSGSWGNLMIDGGSFGGFGCGLCCMANIYSTISPYECSPVAMYHFTKKNTGYYGGGALSWEYMERGMKKAGMDVTLLRRPRKYADFQKKILDSEAAVILVTSYTKNSYWKETSGHYVTIFPLKDQKNKAFLADSGVPEHNRKEVSLSKLYSSLKMESVWQIMVVRSYDKKNDQFRHKGIKEKWVDGRQK